MPKNKILTRRERRFVNKYLIYFDVKKAINKTFTNGGIIPAYIGNILFRRKEVKQEIKTQLAKLETEKDALADYVVLELAKVAFAKSNEALTKEYKNKALELLINHCIGRVVLSVPEALQKD